MFCCDSFWLGNGRIVSQFEFLRGGVASFITFAIDSANKDILLVGDYTSGSIYIVDPV